jgi:hypothetical protein
VVEQNVGIDEGPHLIVIGIHRLAADRFIRKRRRAGKILRRFHPGGAFARKLASISGGNSTVTVIKETSQFQDTGF